MRRLPAVLLCALLALPFSGCLESGDHVTLAADGSGTLDSNYSIDLAKTEEFAQTLQMLLGSGGGGEAAGELTARDPFAPTWFEQYAKASEGYTIKESSQVKADGKRTTAVRAAFTSLEAAARGGAFFSSTVTLSRVEVSDEDPAAPEGGWKLTFKDALTGGGEALGGMDPAQILPMFETQLSGLKLGRKLSLPTAILSTNGTKAEDGKSVAWTVTYDQILEGKDVTMSVVFAADAKLKLKPFTYTPDLMGLSRRFMEKPPAPKPVTTESAPAAPEDPKPAVPAEK